MMAISCREKSVSERKEDPKVSQEKREQESEGGDKEKELQTPEDEIAEHCLGFVRATKVVAAQSPRADCPGCAAEGTEVLTFQRMKTDRISCSAETCEVVVTIRASFKPGSGQTISGGLTAWIPQEQRTAYLSGHPPQGEQVYRVKIIYKRRGESWRAVEFDKADSKP
ncbi:MAG TPA: hypothetical protein VJS88_00945, partial [Chthoniobacterales bacterium]|nr:hypothetical protein [Chthoniobacterales bacterium]